MRRPLTVCAVAAICAGIAGPPAGAATLPPCEPGDGSVPGGTCAPVVEARADCPDGVPTVTYAVTPGTADDDTVEITWGGLPGLDLVMPDQPLSGSLPWPGGTVEPPLRQPVTLVFGTTPRTSVVVGFPECAGAAGPDGPGPSGAPAGRATGSGSGVLAETGGAGARVAAVGSGALVLAGAAAVLIARRGRRHGAAG